MPPMISGRRSWPAILGWSVAVLALAGAGLMSWAWWQQGAENAALRTDLAAAYAEVETLRARPEVVSPPAAVPEPAAVTPAADAPDAAHATSAEVVLVPAGEPVPIAIPEAAATVAKPVGVAAEAPPQT